MSEGIKRRRIEFLKTVLASTKPFIAMLSLAIYDYSINVYLKISCFLFNIQRWPGRNVHESTVKTLSTVCGIMATAGLHDKDGP